jgi:hypothetical protein
MTSIGPYEFSATDVQRTLQAGRTLFDLLPGGFPPDPEGPAAPFRALAEEALDARAASDPEGALGVLWGEWRSAMHALREAGAYGPRAEGEVAGLFLGRGGVPKQPHRAVEVDWSGVVGDRQGNRVHHGRPWQALCLWSEEVIDALHAAGHPIGPGLAGENVTVRAIPWERVVPGAQLRIGEVLAEVSSYAIPCKKNAPWFRDGEFDVMHHRHGAVSRTYATVLEPGAIRVGDLVVLEPDAR